MCVKCVCLVMYSAFLKRCTQFYRLILICIFWLRFNRLCDDNDRLHSLWLFYHPCFFYIWSTIISCVHRDDCPSIGFDECVFFFATIEFVCAWCTCIPVFGLEFMNAQLLPIDGKYHDLIVSRLDMRSLQDNGFFRHF